MSEKYFEKALADFTMDFASGGAIRVMADKGYPVKKIKAKLDFPTPLEKVQDEYGRTSFKQVVIPGDKVLPEYVKCDFGKA